MFDLLTQLKIYGIQYLGSSTGRFKLRQKNCEDNNKKKSAMCRTHETSNIFNYRNMMVYYKIAPLNMIDKTVRSDRSFSSLARLEKYQCRIMLKTVAPTGALTCFKDFIHFFFLRL